jgi:hypothetical protein
MTISKRLRYEILRRDNHACRYCGRAAPAVALAVDHVLPVALGGSSEPANLVAACIDCNAGKASSKPDEALVEQVSDDAIRWARAVAQAAADMSNENRRYAEFVDTFDEGWKAMCAPFGRDNRPVDWAETIILFRDRGLPQDVILASLYTAAAAKHVARSDVWRYFCGICWHKVARLAESAHAILLAERLGDES